jgi:hypothetical protein
MAGGKKHRKSIQNNNNSKSNEQTSSNTPLNNGNGNGNGNDSDYGVFSDPDEISDYQISPSSPHTSTLKLTSNMQETNHEANKAEQDSIIELNEIPSNSAVKESQPILSAEMIDTKEIDPKLLYNSKSIETLKYKLQNDPVYSKKTTHTTFFSFILLSIEIEYACSPSITRLSDISNVLRLIEYVITNHSSTSEVEEYTRNMLDMGIIEHIIRGLIDFNSSNRLVDKESIEQLKQSIMPPQPSVAEQAQTEAPPQNSANLNEVPSADNQPPSTPHKTNRFIQFWRNLSCCCRCRKSRKNSIILDDKLEEKDNKQDEVSNDADIKNKYLAHELP